LCNRQDLLPDCELVRVIEKHRCRGIPECTVERRGSSVFCIIPFLKINSPLSLFTASWLHHFLHFAGIEGEGGSLIFSVLGPGFCPEALYWSIACCGVRAVADEALTAGAGSGPRLPSYTCPGVLAPDDRFLSSCPVGVLVKSRDTVPVLVCTL
jgi:hypothetical protein